jgi:glycyl-tRNA synthetase beta subunit
MSSSIRNRRLSNKRMMNKLHKYESCLNNKKCKNIQETKQKLKKLEKCVNKKCNKLLTTAQDKNNEIVDNCNKTFPRRKNASIFNKKENEKFKKLMECIRNETAKPHIVRLERDMKRCMRHNCGKLI